MSAKTFSLRATGSLSLALLAALIGCATAQAQQKVLGGRAAMTDERFDQWVFQQDRNVLGARQRLDSLLSLRIEDIDRTSALTDAQKKRLHLAGQGDVKRFFDRYETIKQKFQLVKNDDEKMQQLWQEIRPLQTSLQAGLFHSDSLLVKSLHNTLNDDQFARYDAIARERRAFHHRATLELVVTTLEQSMPMRDAQRRALTALLASETKPPRKSGQYDYYLIMFQIGRIPQEKLKPLFDSTQWKVLNRLLDQYKGMEPFLRQSGEWPAEEDEADKSDRQPAVLKR